MSADAVIDEVRKRLENFSVPEEINTEIRNRVRAAHLNALAPIPEWAKDVSVNDWRMFIHREFSLIINEPVQRTQTPWQPRIPQIYQIPFDADDSDCRRGPGPRLLHRAFFRSDRTDRCHEFWMGIEHTATATGGYIIEITSLAANPIYNYITWAGVVGLILSILNFLRVFLKIL